VAIQPDRKIVVVGTTKNPMNDDVLVVRYDTDGNLDTSFGANGVITFDADASSQIGAAQWPSSRMAGFSSSQTAITVLTLST
jgi:hypothetical protein